MEICFTMYELESGPTRVRGSKDGIGKGAASAGHNLRRPLGTEGRVDRLAAGT